MSGRHLTVQRLLAAIGTASIITSPGCDQRADPEAQQFRSEGDPLDDEHGLPAGHHYRNPLKPGAFDVGSQTIFIRDTGRPFDAWGATYGSPDYQALLQELEALGEPRTLVTEIWYPVEHPDTLGLPRATYLDYYASDRAVFDRRPVPPTFLTSTGQTVGELEASDPVAHAALVEDVLDELASRERGSFVGAPIADGEFPLVVLSHGGYLGEDVANANREVWTTEAENLASHGYIVVAMDHLGDSRHTPVFHDEGSALVQQGDPQAILDAYDVLFGEIGVDDKIFANIFVPGKGAPYINGMMQGLLQQRTDDIASVIAHLDEISADPEHFLFGHVDMDHIGVEGFSLGAMTTQIALSTIPEVDAAVGWQGGMPKAWEPPSFQGISKPQLFSLGTEDNLVRTVLSILPFVIYPSMVPGGTPADLLHLPGERVFPPTLDLPEPVVHTAFDRAQGPKLLVEFQDMRHWGVTDVDDSMFPEHRLANGEIDVAFDSTSVRLPYGADVFDPGFVGDGFEVLGWEQKGASPHWTYLPHEIRHYYSVSWFGYYLKEIEQYQARLLDDPFEVTDVLFQDIGE